MNQLTVRGFDEELENRLRRLAKKEHISLNRAASLLLKRGAGLEPLPKERKIGDALDDFIGDWSKEEAEAFERSQKPFEQIDEELWK